MKLDPTYNRAREDAQPIQEYAPITYKPHKIITSKKQKPKP